MLTPEFKAAFLEALREDDQFLTSVATAIAVELSVGMEYQSWTGQLSVTVTLGEERREDSQTIGEQR